MPPPETIDLPGAQLRRLRVDDADAVARAVAESLEHLRPWMPWADDASADPAFQRERLRGAQELWDRGEEYQYGLFDGDTMIGGFGLHSRRGPGTLEIGYWVHVDACGRGHASRAAAALTDAALAEPGVGTVLVYTDEANTRSAAVPRRLGYTLVGVEDAPRSAPDETGRQQVWARTRPISASEPPRA